MVSIDKLKKIVNNRPVLIMLHGASLSCLEDMIEDLKDVDVCYASLNNFPVVEPILEKIGKQLSIVLDCSTVPNTQIYNEQSRIPKLREFLERKDDNLWITTKKLVHIIMFGVGDERFIMESLNKTFILDSIHFDVGRVPNSSVILIGILAIAGAKRIIICGCDGQNPEVEKIANVKTYYKYELQVKDKLLAGNMEIDNFQVECQRVQEESLIFINKYCAQFNVNIPEIVLCNNNTHYNMYPKIKYEKLKQFLNK